MDHGKIRLFVFVVITGQMPMRNYRITNASRSYIHITHKSRTEIKIFQAILDEENVSSSCLVFVNTHIKHYFVSC